jgi:hypothetical protein
VRKRRHRRYLILHHVSATAIDVLHIVHGTRDYRKLFLGL